MDHDSELKCISSAVRMEINFFYWLLNEGMRRAQDTHEIEERGWWQSYWKSCGEEINKRKKWLKDNGFKE
jgi:hypothetical protein